MSLLGTKILQPLNGPTAGGPAEAITSIQYGEKWVISGAVNNVTISAVDTSKSVVIVYVADAGAVDANYHMFIGRLSSSTNLVLERSSSASSAYIYWQVIEFGNAKSMQSGYTAYPDATNTTVTISAVDTTKSMTFCSSLTALTGTNANYHLRGVRINSSTSVRIRNTFAQTIQWYIVELN